MGGKWFSMPKMSFLQPLTFELNNNGQSLKALVGKLGILVFRRVIRTTKYSACKQAVLFGRKAENKFYSLEGFRNKSKFEILMMFNSKFNISEGNWRTITQGIKNSGFSALRSAVLSTQFFTRWKVNYQFKPLLFIP